MRGMGWDLFAITGCVLCLYSLSTQRMEIETLRQSIASYELENKTQQLQIQQLQHNCFVALLGDK